MKKKGFIITGLIVAALLIVIVRQQTSTGEHDAFAQCISDTGAKMYGAFWCPHCLENKRLFGDSFRNIDYIECSTPDKHQTQECADAGITGYPTWEFDDGERHSGVATLEFLAERTGCSLTSPEETADDDEAVAPPTDQPTTDVVTE